MTTSVREPATTVLVVEDEESFIEALTIGLKREGFRVEVARDGAEALDRLDAVHPDLVLLDVMLPTLSGIEVCRQIRTHSRRMTGPPLRRCRPSFGTPRRLHDRDRCSQHAAGRTGERMTALFTGELDAEAYRRAGLPGGVRPDRENSHQSYMLTGVTSALAAEIR